MQTRQPFLRECTCQLNWIMVVTINSQRFHLGPWEELAQVFERHVPIHSLFVFFFRCDNKKCVTYRTVWSFGSRPLRRFRDPQVTANTRNQPQWRLDHTHTPSTAPHRDPRIFVKDHHPGEFRRLPLTHPSTPSPSSLFTRWRMARLNKYVLLSSSLSKRILLLL